MKRVAILSLLLFMALITIGQKNDFCSEIKRVVTDSTSQYFFSIIVGKG
jgi:hypothetical protein